MADDVEDCRIEGIDVQGHDTIRLVERDSIPPEIFHFMGRGRRHAQDERPPTVEDR
jgi:hypothetical protein